MFKTIDKDCEAELVIKKSRFIALAHRAYDEQEVKCWLEALRKQYSDARHIAYAYRIKSGEQIFQKSSDDGEPSGTAGMPILNLIIKEDLINTAIAVVRYFGGIKLGAGGLTRAYAGSANALREHFVPFQSEITIVCEIKFADRLIKYLDNGGFDYAKSFGEKLVVKVMVSDAQKLMRELDYVEFVD